MAKSKPNNNVFKFLSMFEDNLSELEQTGVISRIDNDSKSEKTYSSEEASKVIEAGKMFLSNFKDYLRRGDYTKSKSDIELVEYKLAGRTNADIIGFLSINDSTLRMRYARLTKKVYRSAFDRETVPDDLVWLANEKVIKKANNCLHAAVLRLNLSDVFAFDTLKAIEQTTKDIHVDGRVGSDKEYCEAFRFIALYSLNTFKTVLNNLNPTVLAYIISEMKSKKVNSTCSLYNKIMENPDNILNMTFDDIRDFIDGRSFEFSHRGDFSEYQLGVVYESTFAEEKEKELTEREHALELKEKKLSTREAKLKQQEDNLQSQIVENSKDSLNGLNIPKDLVSIIQNYIDAYEKGIRNHEDIYRAYNYDGVHENLKNTVVATEDFFKLFTVEGFRKRLTQLNPYDVKTFIEDIQKK